jgi:hypothetical protein
MQLIGAYLIFLLVIVALGLGVILCGVVAIALYEGAVWFRTAHRFAARPQGIALAKVSTAGH